MADDWERGTPISDDYFSVGLVVVNVDLCERDEADYQTKGVIEMETLCAPCRLVVESWPARRMRRG